MNYTMSNSSSTQTNECVLKGLTDSFELSPYITGTAIITAIINILTSITAVVSNALIINGFRTNSHLRKKSSNATVFCLALMDAIIGLIAQPFFAVRRILALINHREDCITVVLYNHFATILAGASLSTLAVIGFERYLSIVFPIKHRLHVTSLRMVGLVSSLWVTGIFQAMQIYYGGTYTSYIYVSSFCIMLCLVSCLVFYIEMFRKVRQSSAHVGKAVQEKQKKEFKIAKNMAFIIILMLLCYTPSFVSFVLGSDISKRTFMWQNVYPWTDTLAYINSTINPFILCWKNIGIRNEVFKSLRCVFKTGRTINPVPESTTAKGGQNSSVNAC